MKSGGTGGMHATQPAQAEMCFMFRANAASPMLLVFAAIALSALASVVYVLLGGGTPAGNNDKNGSLVMLNQRLQRRLAQRIDLNNGVGPSTTLNDALEYFSDKYGMPILIDFPAFEEIG